MKKIAYLVIVVLLFTYTANVKGDAAIGLAHNLPHSLSFLQDTVNFEVLFWNSESAEDDASNLIIKIIVNDSHLSIEGSDTKDWKGLILQKGALYRGSKFTIKFAPNTPPGNYSVTIRVDYKYGTSYLSSGSDSMIGYIEVKPQLTTFIEYLHSIFPFLIVALILFAGVFAALFFYRLGKKRPAQILPVQTS